jgi:hypothetical protein
VVNKIEGSASVSGVTWSVASGTDASHRSASLFSDLDIPAQIWWMLGYTVATPLHYLVVARSAILSAAQKFSWSVAVSRQQPPP